MIKRITTTSFGKYEMLEQIGKGQQYEIRVEDVVREIFRFKQRGISKAYRFNGFLFRSDCMESVEQALNDYNEYIFGKKEIEDIRYLSIKDIYDIFEQEVYPNSPKQVDLGLKEITELLLRLKEAHRVNFYHIYGGLEINTMEITSSEEAEKLYELYRRENIREDALLRYKSATKDILALDIPMDVLVAIIVEESGRIDTKQQQAPATK